MPLTIAPNLIEVSDFSGGWMPDLERTAVPTNGLLTAFNLLPQRGSGTVQTRAGYKRVMGSIVQGYQIESIHAYNRLAGVGAGQYLMLVMSNGKSGVPNNVAVYALDLKNLTAAQVSPADRTWASPDGQHWGATVNQKFYGGGPKDPMYSWNPVDGWDDAPSKQDFKTLVDSQDPGADQRAYDYAFKLGDEVLYSSPAFPIVHAYSAAVSNRFSNWKLGEDYKIGDLVSMNWTGAPSGGAYMRSWECIGAHTATEGNKPGSGAGMWKKHNLALPLDEEGEVTEDWNGVPAAAVTNVGAWHGERLWLRYDDSSQLGQSRLQYSAPSVPDKDTDIADLIWDPTDFRPDSNDEGEGGGFIDFRTGDGDPITALWDYGYYLLVFKRRSTHVVAGFNRNTWTVRQLAHIGAVGPRAVCECENLVYFVSDGGLFKTDGTTVTEVAGHDKVRNWLRNSIDWETDPSPTVTSVANDVSAWSSEGLVWVSLPLMIDQRPSNVLVYDPKAESFWLTGLRVQAVAQNKRKGLTQVFFSTPVIQGDSTVFGSTYAWLGTRLHSQSTRTNPDTTVETNLFKDPSFEPESDGQSLEDAKAAMAWIPASSLTFNLTTGHALRGLLGAHLHNDIANTYRGIRQSFADSSTDPHTISCFARRESWEIDNTIDYSVLRFRVGSGDPDDGIIPSTDTTFTYLGGGWWRCSGVYTGSLSVREHLIQVAHGPGSGGYSVNLDKVLCQKGGLRPYFDGDGGDDTSQGGTVGGEWAVVYQYDHPDLALAPSDDKGEKDYTSQGIPWTLGMAWFPFGTLREDRRIRRVWALVRGKFSMTLTAYRNYDDTVETTKSGTPTGAVSYFEGVTMKDAHAVRFQLEGTSGGSAVLGLAVETQPRRVRYHK